MNNKRNELLPVFGGVSNREIFGHANSLAQAKRIIKKVIDVVSPFDLTVWRRSTFTRELLNVPDGYVFSISYSYSRL